MARQRPSHLSPPTSRAVVAAAIATVALSLGGTASAVAIGRHPSPEQLVPSVNGGPVRIHDISVLPSATPTVAQPTGPIDVPDNSYAPEAVVKIGRIQVPRLGLDADMYNGVTLNNIDFGPSHWPGTAMPGQTGNVVIAGHRVTHTHPFREIQTMVPGDQVVFLVEGVRSVYEMVSNEVVTPAGTHIANQGPAATATLFACHPPHSAKYRFVVHLVLVETGPIAA